MHSSGCIPLRRAPPRCCSAAPPPAPRRARGKGVRVQARTKVKEEVPVHQRVVHGEEVRVRRLPRALPQRGVVQPIRNNLRRVGDFARGHRRGETLGSHKAHSRVLLILVRERNLKFCQMVRLSVSGQLITDSNELLAAVASRGGGACVQPHHSRVRVVRAGGACSAARSARDRTCKTEKIRRRRNLPIRSSGKEDPTQ